MASFFIVKIKLFLGHSLNITKSPGIIWMKLTYHLY